MVSRFERVRAYLRELNHALEAVGFERQRFMNLAREQQAAMNERELKSLGEELIKLKPEAIRIALGIGLKTPTRNIIDEAITKKGVTL